MSTKLKIDEPTLNALKNFATINTSLVFRENGHLRTINEESGGFRAEFQSLVKFPYDFGVYDLPQFLKAMTLVSRGSKPTDVVLDFSEQGSHCFLKCGRNKIRYVFSPVDLLVSPKKDVKPPKGDIQLLLTNDDINNIRSMSSFINAKKVFFTPHDDTSIKIEIYDDEDRSGNRSETIVEGTSDLDHFHVGLDVDYLKMLADDYQLSISSKKVTHWKGVKHGLVYYAVTTMKSQFGKEISS